MLDAAKISVKPKAPFDLSTPRDKICKNQLTWNLKNPLTKISYEAKMDNLADFLLYGGIAILCLALIGKALTGSKRDHDRN